MGYGRLQFDLPLLRKELIEQSARRRTYVMRVLFALIIYALFLVYSQSELSIITGSQLTLGYGKILFGRLMFILVIGLMLVTPMMAATSITTERERGTLELLLVTKLSPTTIFFEKLLGVMVPALSYVILMLPLLAVIYALGGVGTFEFLGSVLGILVLILINCGMGVCISAWAKTSFSALMRCLYGIPLYYFVCSMFLSAYIAISFASQSVVGMLMANGIFIGLNLFIFIGIGAGGIRDADRKVQQPVHRTMVLTHQGGSKQKVDIVKRPSRPLPVKHPLSWQQSVSHPFGNTLFVSTLTLLVMVPLLMLVLLGSSSWRFADETLIAFEGIFWGVGVPIISLMTSMLFQQMYAKQTLDTLLATPMRTDELVTETQLPARNWIFVTLLIAGILSLLKVLILGFDRFSWQQTPILLTACDEVVRIVTGWLMLVALMWYGTLAALVFRSSIRSSVMVMAGLVVVFLVPMLSGLWDLFLLKHIIRVPESTGPDATAIQCLLVMFVPVVLLRFVVLTQADALLGRLDATSEKSSHSAGQEAF